MTIDLNRKTIEAARIYDAAVTILALADIFDAEAMKAVVSKLRSESSRSADRERELMLRMSDLIADIARGESWGGIAIDGPDVNQGIDG